MPPLTDWLITLIAGGLGLSACVLLLLGLNNLRESQRHSYYQLRRAQINRGWGRIVTSMLVGLLAFGVWAGVKPLIEVFISLASVSVTTTPAAPLVPTLAPTPNMTLPPSPTVSLIVTAEPSPSLPPSNTPPQLLETLTPTETLPPATTGTPALPLERVTPPGTVAVTPLADAVMSPLRFSRFNDCADTTRLADTFTPNPKTIYALFEYNNWTPGAQWSDVWRRDGEIIVVGTYLWDGSTGGCGYADFDNNGRAWPEGAYEVQIFLGEVWMDSGTFTIVASP